jgi:hypothetical protein
VNPRETRSYRELVEAEGFMLTRPRSLSGVKRLMRVAVEIENKPLHGAEAEALAIIKGLHGILIADDHDARYTARLMQVECHGTSIWSVGCIKKVKSLETKTYRDAKSGSASGGRRLPHVTRLTRKPVSPKRPRHRSQAGDQLGLQRLCGVSAILLPLALRRKLTARMSIANISIATGSRSFVGAEVGMLEAI